MSKSRSNIQFIKDLMEKSNYGAMAQLFVIDAIAKHADLVAESKPEDYPENSFVHPSSWIGVAKEIQVKFLERHNIKVTQVRGEIK